MQAPSCATSVGDAKSKWPGCLFRGELQRPNPKPHGASEKLLRATWKPGSRQLKGRERDAPQQADGTPRDFDSRCLPPQRSSLPSPHDQRSGWALCRGRAAARAEPAQVQLGAGVSGVLETPSGKEAAEREHPVRELPEGGAAAREPWQWGCGAGYSGPESHTRLTWAPWTARGLSPLLLLKSQKGDIPGRLRRGRRTVLDRLVARAWISLCSCKIHCSSSRPYMSHLTTADRRPVGPLLPDKGRGNTRRLPWPPRPPPGDDLITVPFQLPIPLRLRFPEPAPRLSCCPAVPSLCPPPPSPQTAFRGRRKHCFLHSPPEAPVWPDLGSFRSPFSVPSSARPNPLQGSM